MKITSDLLIQKILDLMVVSHECYSKTTFANDRHLYAKNITAAMGWIAELRAGADIVSVRDKILSPETDKFFYDYFRQGEWGEKEIKALMKLKDSI